MIIFKKINNFSIFRVIGGLSLVFSSIRFIYIFFIFLSYIEPHPQFCNINFAHLLLFFLTIIITLSWIYGSVMIIKGKNKKGFILAICSIIFLFLISHIIKFPICSFNDGPPWGN